jgi:16S rRNA (cytosine1402-N4)-methyltransferase
MLDSVLEVLRPQPGATAVDCTIGLAGHALPLIRLLGPTGKLIGLDWDADNLARAGTLLGATDLPVSLHHSNFAALVTVLAAEGVPGVDMVLADLGMSSMQVDDAERGFSYLRDGPLDMRMDRSRGRSAADLLATIDEAELARSLRELSDEPDAERIAAALVAARQRAPLSRTTEVAEVIAATVGKPASRAAGWRLRPARDRWNMHPAARTFQALRILVNRELANLDHLLRVLPQCLRPGGRVAILSFHSGEDRLVKSAFRAGLRAGVYEAIADDPLRATAAERAVNPRARSAKLRWARR